MKKLLVLMLLSMALPLLAKDPIVEESGDFIKITNSQDEITYFRKGLIARIVQLTMVDDKFQQHPYVKIIWSIGHSLGANAHMPTEYLFPFDTDAAAKAFAQRTAELASRK